MPSGAVERDREVEVPLSHHVKIQGFPTNLIAYPLRIDTGCVTRRGSRPFHSNIGKHDVRGRN